MFFPETSRSLSCRSFTADWSKFLKQRSMAMRLLTPCRGCTSSFLPTSTPDSKDFCQISLSVHSHYLTLHLSCRFIMSSPIISPHSISIPVSPIIWLQLILSLSTVCLSTCHQLKVTSRASAEGVFTPLITCWAAAGTELSCAQRIVPGFGVQPKKLQSFKQPCGCSAALTGQVYFNSSY